MERRLKLVSGEELPDLLDKYNSLDDNLDVVNLGEGVTMEPITEL